MTKYQKENITIDLQLSTNTIKPRIDQVSFSGIISPNTGQVTGSTRTQPGVADRKNIVAGESVLQLLK